MEKSRRSKIEHKVDAELIAKGKNVVKDFDESQALFVRPTKMPNRLISIRLPIAMIEKLYEVADRKGSMGYQQLIKVYLKEALDKEDDQSDSNNRLKYFFNFNEPSSSSSVPTDLKTGESIISSGSAALGYRERR